MKGFEQRRAIVGGESGGKRPATPSGRPAAERRTTLRRARSAPSSGQPCPRGRRAIAERRKRGEGKPETFDFLGFTHICEINRKSGYFVVKRKTNGKRKRAKLLDIKRQWKLRMHAPLRETGEWLRSVVSGYFRYHGVPGNFRVLAGFRRVVSWLWLQTLRRRSQKSRRSWRRFYELERRYLPPPPRARACHRTPG